jgi:hypothetical protein
MALTVEYLFSAFLAFSCQNNSSCFWLDPGTRYESRSPTQNPNWCVINRGAAKAPVRLEFIPGPRMILAPGIEPCDSGRVPTS